MFALIKVDMQKDFALPSGSLYVPGGEEIILPLQKLVKEAYSYKLVVVSTADIHHYPDPESVEGGGPWPSHCIAGSEGALIVPELLPKFHLGEILIFKGTFQYSAFTPEKNNKSYLAQLLLERGVKRIYLTGLALDYCVGETALDGVKEGFEVYVIKELTRAVSKEGEDRILARFKEVEVKVIDTTEAIKHWKGELS